MYALTIFLGAFLVFQIQPIAGKFILPWFGGGPGVWTACLLFFQITLLLGYAYAHLIVMRLNAKRQAILHSGLLLGSLLLLPITPDKSWSTMGIENPTWTILALLAFTVGAPYALLSSTTPLVQTWFARDRDGKTPYRLFALSNLAALLALLSYPTIVEPLIPVQYQAWMWSACYVGFVAACTTCALQAFRTQHNTASGTVAEIQPTAARPASKATPIDALLWLVLSSMGTVMLMATTNQICLDVAAIPFLWVLPMALYLISFIVCFNRQRWYHRGFWTITFVSSLAVTVLMLRETTLNVFGSRIEFHAGHDLVWQILVLTITMFSCMMCCHGELARLRPKTGDPTLYYLMIAGGGALGGLFVAEIAPRIFTGYDELHIGLLGTCAAIMIARRREQDIASGDSSFVHWRRWTVGFATVAVAFVGMRVHLMPPAADPNSEVVESERNFFGVLTVRRETHDDAEEPATERLVLSHGSTLHGSQFAHESLRREPTTYYGRRSGIGVAIENHPRRVSGDGRLRIGGVGLGVGTIAAYAHEGDVFRFYEVNPAVARMARKHFSYLDEAEAAGADVQVLLGDARVVMEQQFDSGESQQFDILAVDAFSSAAIPTHLLTRECIEVYRNHLAPGGVLAIHITNVHFELAAVVRGLAEEGGMRFVLVDDQPGAAARKHNPELSPSQWALLTHDERFLAQPGVRAFKTPWPATKHRTIWTDGYSSLFGLLRRPEIWPRVVSREAG
ncbi:MAG: fused MFS/spermidine synthase [Pirellulales bacterium]|nr:fused MFS/spermidine synthase [Pirellulales bacterium]